MFDDPTYALLFLDPAVQPRFVFTAVGRTTIDGADAAEVNFIERQTPTVVQNRGHDVPARGVLWIRTTDAAVVRTRLKLSTPMTVITTGTMYRIEVTDAQIDVDYASNAALGLLLPSRMEESYSRTERTDPPDTSVERVHCTAVYSNFRRFETAVRVLPSRN